MSLVLSAIKRPYSESEKNAFYLFNYIHKNPSILIDMNPELPFNMLQSNEEMIQLLGLIIIKINLINSLTYKTNDKLDKTNKIINRLTNKIDKKIYTSQSERNLQLTNRSNEIIWINEIFNSGTIRSIVWMLIHQCLCIRILASEILNIIKSFYYKFISNYLSNTLSTNQSNKINSSTNKLSNDLLTTLRSNCNIDLWISFIEQGLVVVISYIANGIDISISSNNKSFPEESIRLLCNQLIDLLNIYIVNSPLFRETLFSSMIYSNNKQLKFNILTGLIYLSSNKQILRLLIDSRLNNSSNGILYTLILDILKSYDQSDELLDLTNLLINFLSTLQSNHLVGSLFNPLTINDLSSKGSSIHLLDDNQALVKIVSPNHRVLTYHSEVLADLIHRQSKDNVAIPAMKGSYRLWQEIFSHMTHDYLLDQSISKMATSDIIEIYKLSIDYNMIYLQSKYVNYLTKRLNPIEFLTILHCAMIKNTNVNNQIVLLTNSLQYIASNIYLLSANQIIDKSQLNDIVNWYIEITEFILVDR